MESTKTEGANGVTSLPQKRKRGRPPKTDGSGARLMEKCADGVYRYLDPAYRAYSHLLNRGVRRLVGLGHHPDAAICREWREDREAFVRWFREHTKGLQTMKLFGRKGDAITIARLDPSRGFSPDNCAIMTKSEYSSRYNGARRKSDFARKHGETCGGKVTPLFRIWHHMKDVTVRPSDKGWIGRPEWKVRRPYLFAGWLKFTVFRDWAIANGYRDGLTLGRKDLSLGFVPENCAFYERCNVPTHHTHHLTDMTGREWSIAQIARKIGVTKQAVSYAVNHAGKTVDDLLLRGLVRKPKTKGRLVKRVSEMRTPWRIDPSRGLVIDADGETVVPIGVALSTLSEDRARFICDAVNAFVAHGGSGRSRK